jgi:Glycosyl transferase family 2
MQPHVLSSPEQSLVTVIITHYNYADHVGAALQSVIAQTHKNFDCVVVDDCSLPEERDKLRAIVERLGDPRIRLLELAENRGQTNAVFAALGVSRGEFVSLLDPDDLYDAHFLERMLKCHLNPIVYAPVAACEMGLFRTGGGVVARNSVGYRYYAIEKGDLPRAEARQMDFGFSAYFPSTEVGWLWGTTSSLMFRRNALELLRADSFPPELKICADTYCVYGAHMLGGTLFLDDLLSWRGVHGGNVAATDKHFSRFQNRQWTAFVDHSTLIKAHAIQSMLANGAAEYLKMPEFAETLKAHMQPPELKLLLSPYPELVLDLFLGSTKPGPIGSPEKISSPPKRAR